MAIPILLVVGLVVGPIVLVGIGVYITMHVLRKKGHVTRPYLHNNANMVPSRNSSAAPVLTNPASVENPFEYQPSRTSRAFSTISTTVEVDEAVWPPTHSRLPNPYRMARGNDFSIPGVRDDDIELGTVRRV
ncbi:hypothetical protein P154DRAFT_523784 [Amniculicola lignicola CBS 123094]|uniref:Uncharacterized protein n=1 Tax=Amniculicola lignicola CBS 123094 TaxID=1392246 RepID=A0A6A5WF15_9PLEO|nr:hypothetical protein P154DRAFT_523784 [Amniculicola lignicola CBS 123094]